MKQGQHGVRNPIQIIRLIFLGIVMLCCGSMKMTAQEKDATVPRVEISLREQRPFWVGEQIPVYVKIFVEGQFSGSTQFEIPKIADGILMQSEDHPVIDAQTEGGKQVFSQLYTFFLYCGKDGSTSIPEWSVDFSSKKAFNAPVEQHSVKIPVFTVKTRLPEGAKPGEFIISTEDFQVIESWEPKPASEKTGNAFKRIVRMQAKDVPSMLFPRLPDLHIGGLSVYSKKPVLQDENERQGLTGKRTDETDFVCERAGHYAIPAMTFRWWNIKEKAWKEITLPAVSFDVTGETVASIGIDKKSVSDVSESNTRINWLIGLGGIIATVIACIFFFRKKENEEKKAFNAMMRFCQRKDAKKTYLSYLAWIKTAGVNMSGQPAVSKHVWAEFQEAVASGTAWNSHAFGKEIRTYRRRLISRSKRQFSKKVLPPLNP